MSTFQRCNRCIMDNVSDTNIRFDRDGNCNYCTAALAAKPYRYFPNGGVDLPYSPVKCSILKEVWSKASKNISGHSALYKYRIFRCTVTVLGYINV